MRFGVFKVLGVLEVQGFRYGVSWFGVFKVLGFAYGVSRFGV